MGVSRGDSAGMTRSIPIEKILDDCIVAYAMNGERFVPSRVSARWWCLDGRGNMWVKWLRRLEFGDMPYMAREETSKYTDLLKDGNAHVHLGDGRKICCHVALSEKAINNKGVQLLKGIAWSGQVKIKRVDVSLDAGRNWQTAELHGPVLDKVTCPVHYAFEWNGEEMFIQSRAIDETGYISQLFKRYKLKEV